MRKIQVRPKRHTNASTLSIRQRSPYKGSLCLDSRVLQHYHSKVPAFGKLSSGGCSSCHGRLPTGDSGRRSLRSTVIFNCSIEAASYRLRFLLPVLGLACLCMCVCILCMHAFQYACKYACVYVRMPYFYTYVRACVRSQHYLCTYVRTYVCMCLSVCLSVGVSVCLYVRLHENSRVYVPATVGECVQDATQKKYLHACGHVCMYVSQCMYVGIH